MMKSWKVKIYLKGSKTIDIVIQAKSKYDAEQIIKLQYGATMTGFGIPTEVR